jgi:hypothetical protein
MRRNFLLFFIIVIGLLLAGGLVFAKVEIDSDSDGLSDREEQRVYFTNFEDPDTDKDTYPDGVEVIKGFSPLDAQRAKLTNVNLAVPYINEAPDNKWVGPWKNACEEASIAMVEKYYLGKIAVSISEAKPFMLMMFVKQNAIWKTNADSDANRTAQLINDYTMYNAKIIDNPTIEDIKKELQQKRPVITPLYGFDLHNPNIPFVPAPRGSSYHMLVPTGYDDTTNEFIANDPGDFKQGHGYRYGYTLFMEALHDFDLSVHKANGPARAIYTYPKLVKTADSHRIYYLHDDIKQYVTRPDIFRSKKWSWDAVNPVTLEWLDAFKNGNDLK